MKILNAGILGCGLFFSWTVSTAADELWKSEQIADAVTAAPISVTGSATIYAWESDGTRVLLREGDGPFVCVASGMTSTRVGKDPLPFPDPACFDQNAWKFFKAFWAESNPMKPSKPYPVAPGTVWMLAGMGVSSGMVKVGTDAEAVSEVAKNGQQVHQLSPHMMIMPLPVAQGKSVLPGKYDTDNPGATWTMFAQTPLEHIMVHFSDNEVDRMMRPIQ